MYCDRVIREGARLRTIFRDGVFFFPSPQKHGLVIIPDGTPNGDVSHEAAVGAIAVVSQEAAQVLESAGEGPLGKRLVSVSAWIGVILLDFQLVRVSSRKTKTAQGCLSLT